MKQQELILIDQYLEGTLSIPETTKFERRLWEDDEFRNQFEQVKMVITGIQSCAILDEIDRVKQIARFLEQGGILLRENISVNDEYVIEKLSMDRDWSIILICENSENCLELIDRLVKDNPDKFRKWESKSAYYVSEGMANQFVM